MERSQMSLNRGKDTEYVVYLHNGVLLSYLKQWIHEIPRQMDGSGGCHPKWGNLVTKVHSWYEFTDKWILVQKLRIPKIQFAKHMKLKKKEDQSVNTLPLLRIGNKIPMERSYRDKVWSWDRRKDHPETTPPGDPSHNQPPNADTIACASQQEFLERSLL